MKKTDKGKERTNRRTCQKILYTVMVTNALYNVSHHLRIKKMKRQLHQLCQKVRNKGDGYTRIHMQQYPATDKLYR